MDVAAEPSPISVSPRRTHVAHAWLRSPLYGELQLEANRRRQHVDQLTADIVAAAIVLGRVDELLLDAKALVSA